MFNNTFLLALYTVNQNKDCFEFNRCFFLIINHYFVYIQQRNTCLCVFGGGLQ